MYVFDELTVPGLDVIVTERLGGVSSGPYDSLNLGLHVGDDAEKVHENRSRVAAALGAEELCIVRQVHGSRILLAAATDASDQADALLITKGGPAAAILVADCVPLIVIDPVEQRAVLVHAGWKGLAAGIVESAIRELGNPERLLVAVGPSISGEAYQVGPDVIDAQVLFRACATPDIGDRWRLDLRFATLAIVTEAGVPEGRVTMSAQVTDGGESFFSDRALRPCGRFALAARWT